MIPFIRFIPTVTLGVSHPRGDDVVGGGFIGSGSL
jgi:hypothetical protein